MTPEQAYEKRYGVAWYDAPGREKDLWMAAWTIAWAMAEHNERQACAWLCDDMIGTRAMARHCADAIRARGETK